MPSEILHACDRMTNPRILSDIRRLEVKGGSDCSYRIIRKTSDLDPSSNPKTEG